MEEVKEPVRTYSCMRQWVLRECLRYFRVSGNKVAKLILSSSESNAAANEKDDRLIQAVLEIYLKCPPEREKKPQPAPFQSGLPPSGTPGTFLKAKKALLGREFKYSHVT